MMKIDRIQQAIRGESLDGWLFCNFAHRDTLSDTILCLDPQSVSSRRWFYFIPATGNPTKIVHAIEKGILETLPGDRCIYSGKTELVSLLERFRGLSVAILCDPDLQVLSTIDAASARLIEDAGMKTSSAASLVQRTKGILDEKDIASHEKAAKILYRIVHDAWGLVIESFRSGTNISEGELQDFMVQEFDKEGLITHHPPIVAAGQHSGDPHYDIPQDSTFHEGITTKRSRGKCLAAGDVVQFDIWAKFPEGIYADISWIGYCGKIIPEDIARKAEIVFQARDLVLPAIERAVANEKAITGSKLDAQVRAFLLDRVPSGAVQHRTGHGIDTDCHGSGVNLDSVEFPDNRLLIEGSCFSVEPGIYFSDYGFRTEIDIYIMNRKPVISGGPIQHALLTLQEIKQ